MCFFKEKPSLQPFQIDGNELESMSPNKLLGLVIQSNLKWNEHIDLIISKASKRLHILRVLRRGGVPPKDLLLIYFALIHTVLYWSIVVLCGITKFPSTYQRKSNVSRKKPSGLYCQVYTTRMR